MEFAVFICTSIALSIHIWQNHIQTTVRLRKSNEAFFFFAIVERHCGFNTAWNHQIIWLLGREIPHTFKKSKSLLWTMLKKEKNILWKRSKKDGCMFYRVFHSNIYSPQHPVGTLQLPRAFTHPAAANILTKLPLLHRLSYHPEYHRAPMGVGLLPINFPPIIMTCRKRERELT